jgi:hypothetical protein
VLGAAGVLALELSLLLAGGVDAELAPRESVL